MIELANDFRVALPVDQAWAVLTDVERVAPCMPGAQLQEIEGDEFRGVVKVKVGPITAQYKGAASFVEKDDAAHRAVLKGEGRDTRGQGNASATIIVTLVADGPGATSVTIETSLAVSGKVAQFGRGVMADVSTKLIGQFVACLEREVLAGAGPAPAAVSAAPGAGPGVDGGAAPATRPGETGTPGAEPATPTPDASTAIAPAAAPPAAAPPGAASSVPAEPPAAHAGPRRVDSRPAAPVDLLDAAGGDVAKRVVPVLAGLVVVVLLWRRGRRRRR